MYNNFSGVHAKDDSLSSLYKKAVSNYKSDAFAKVKKRFKKPLVEERVTSSPYKKAVLVYKTPAFAKTVNRVKGVSSKEGFPNSLKKLRSRDNSIRGFFGKRISRLRNKKRFTPAIVYAASQGAPLLTSSQPVSIISTSKKIDALIAKNKVLRDQLIIDNKLFQRNMRLKNDSLIEQVRRLGNKERRIDNAVAPQTPRPPLPLVNPIGNTSVRSPKIIVPDIDAPEKTNLLIPIIAGIGALMMIKG